MGFAILSLVFTSMTFVLANPPYHFSDFQVGLFGLLGVIGIFSSSWSGKTVGKGRVNFVAILCIGLMLFSCIPLFFAQQNIVAYAVGVLMSYFGLTAFHVLNQNLVYRIDATARSRINAVYMTIYFFRCSTWFTDGGLRMATPGLDGLCCQYFGICHRDFAD